MPSRSFVSFAARGEDVVLHRALGGTPPVPRYCVLGGAPLRGLDDHGWSRLEASDAASVSVQAMIVRIEPDEPGAVITAQPWVCLVPGRGEGPLAAALRAAGYTQACFDGASTFLIHPRRCESLLPLLDHPAQPDEFVPAQVIELQHEVQAWQSRALEPWSIAAATQITAGRIGGAEALARELDAIRSTVSWRVTAPLRALRRRQTGR